MITNIRVPCWNPSLRHRRRASIRLAGYYGYSDTRAVVTENPPPSYSHVDCTVEYINHVFTRLVLYQLATSPIELPSWTRNLIVWHLILLHIALIMGLWSTPGGSRERDGCIYECDADRLHQRKPWRCIVCHGTRRTRDWRVSGKCQLIASISAVKLRDESA